MKTVVLALLCVALGAASVVVQNQLLAEPEQVTAFCPDVDGKAVVKAVIQQTGETRCYYYVPKFKRRKM